MSRQRFLHPRDEILLTMDRIYRYRMTTTSGGNLSVRDETGAIWITPARIDKGSLGRDDIVCVRPDGRVEGIRKPSSEFPFHRAIYEARPDVRGIVHAHPVALVAFSAVHAVPDTRLFHQARHVCGEAGFAPYALPGSEALGRNIAAAFARRFDCVMLENHGVVTSGDSLTHAFQRFETLEFTAKTLIKAGQLGPVRALDDARLGLPKAHAGPLPAFPPGEPTTREKDLRRQICDFVRRGYHQRLLISTEGSFSARLDGDAFLVTPYQADRAALEPEEIVLVRGGAAEEGKTPSRAARNHRAIYDRHPGVGAIVNAYPVNATAFTVTGVALDTRTIPESYLLLRDVARIPFGVQFRDGAELAAAVGPDRPAALLENDGVLIAGKDVLDAFDRLEVLESTAEALINARPLGPLAPMPPAAIDELVRAFPAG
jgi:L-fuculose-phosphate aldolase